MSRQIRSLQTPLTNVTVSVAVWLSVMATASAQPYKDAAPVAEPASEAQSPSLVLTTTTLKDLFMMSDPDLVDLTPDYRDQVREYRASVPWQVRDITFLVVNAPAGSRIDATGVNAQGRALGSLSTSTGGSTLRMTIRGEEHRSFAHDYGKRFTGLTPGDNRLAFTMAAADASDEAGTPKLKHLVIHREPPEPTSWKEASDMLRFAAESGHPHLLKHLLDNDFDGLGRLSNRPADGQWSTLTSNLLIQALANVAPLSDERRFVFVTGQRDEDVIDEKADNHERYLEIVRQLVAAGARVNQVANASGSTSEAFRGYSPLMIAASKGHKGVVRLLLKRGADAKYSIVDVGPSESTTVTNALQLAALGGYSGIVRALVDSGADVNAALSRDHSAKLAFRTPLMLAAGKGSASTVAVLLAAGARVNDATPPDDVNIQYAGATALFLAAARGSSSTMEHLLRAGADINRPLPLRAAGASQNFAGFSPLMIAAEKGHRGAVRASLKAGADVRYTVPKAGDEGAQGIGAKTAGLHALSVAQRHWYPRLTRDIKRARARSP